MTSTGKDQDRGGSTTAKDLLDAVAGKSTAPDGSKGLDSERNQSEKPTIYEALGVSQDATEHEIRKAYFKLAVKVHPDRNPDDAQATERFQSLQKIYEVLMDPEKRRIYDQTGCLDDEDMLSEEKFESLYEYYKKQFNEVTADAIEEFKSSYQMSEEEMNDVLCYYEEFHGNMQSVFDHVMLSEPDVDSERFQTYIDDALEDGRLSECYDMYKSWKSALSKKKRKRSSKKVAAPPKKSSQKKSKASSMEDLAGAIMARRHVQSGIQSLAEKYGCGSLDCDPIVSEEEFQKARARLDAKKHSKK